MHSGGFEIYLEILLRASAMFYIYQVVITQADAPRAVFLGNNGQTRCLVVVAWAKNIKWLKQRCRLGM